MPKVLDAVRSRELAQTIKAKAKAPFDNAYAAVQAMPEAEYVQGFLVAPGQASPIEHAWIELDEHILDPNLPSLQKKAESLSYFPAQRLGLLALDAAITEAREDYPDDEPLPIYGTTPYDYYGDVMLGGKDYSTAFTEAKAKCRELKATAPKSTPKSAQNNGAG
jgi:hypothetical protein